MGSADRSLSGLSSASRFCECVADVIAVHVFVASPVEVRLLVRTDEDAVAVDCFVKTVVGGRPWPRPVIDAEPSVIAEV